MVNKARISQRTVWGLLACCPLLLAGCAGDQAEKPAGVQAKPAEAKPQAGHVRVSRSELFRGDLERIEPHLGLTASGCVKVESDEQIQFVRASLDVWRNGKVEPRRLGARLFPPGTPHEVSISLKEEHDPKASPRYRVTTVLSYKNGRDTDTIYVDVPELKLARRTPKTLFDPIEISKGKEAAVWGLVAGEPFGNWKVDEPIEEVARRVEWALVLKLRPLGDEGRNPD